MPLSTIVPTVDIDLTNPAQSNAVAGINWTQPGDIDLEASAHDGKIEIRILDRAPAFDATSAPRREPGTVPAPTRIGGMGLGIELLRTLTDEVHHSARPDGGNELTLVRSIDSPTQEE